MQLDESSKREKKQKEMADKVISAFTTTTAPSEVSEDRI